MGSLFIGLIILLAAAGEAIFNRKKMLARGKEEAVMCYTALAFFIIFAVALILVFIIRQTDNWKLLDAPYWVLGIGGGICVINIIVLAVISTIKNDREDNK